MLLFGLTYLMQLKYPVFSAFGRAFSWQDMILIGGGLFLIGKATHEIHAEVEAEESERPGAKSTRLFRSSCSRSWRWTWCSRSNSIVTAIGMAQDIEIMIAAVVIAMIVMYAASGPVAHFVAQHPTTKMLALAFLVMIGVALVADGFDSTFRAATSIPRWCSRVRSSCSTCWRGRNRARKRRARDASR